MIKHEMILALPGLVFIAGMGFAQAGPPPLPGHCQNQEVWRLVKVAHAADRKKADTADVNGDHVVCEKLEGQGKPYEDNILNNN